MKLDPRIAALVIALRAAGISTTMSCQGHSWRPYPWVSVKAIEKDKLEDLMYAFNSTQPETSVLWAVVLSGLLKPPRYRMTALTQVAAGDVTGLESDSAFAEPEASRSASPSAK